MERLGEAQQGAARLADWIRSQLDLILKKWYRSASNPSPCSLFPLLLLPILSSSSCTPFPFFLYGSHLLLFFLVLLFTPVNFLSNLLPSKSFFTSHLVLPSFLPPYFVLPFSISPPSFLIPLFFPIPTPSSLPLSDFATAGYRIHVIRSSLLGKPNVLFLMAQKLHFLCFCCITSKLLHYRFLNNCDTIWNRKSFIINCSYNLLS